jgi:hypothetical protein
MYLVLQMEQITGPRPALYAAKPLVASLDLFHVFCSPVLLSPEHRSPAQNRE